MDGGRGLGSGWIGAATALGLLLMSAMPAHALTRCQLEYSLDGWSVFYKEAIGEGVIACDNGQRASVDLETRGGGITFGRSKIVGGLGDFSPVVEIRDLFGDYADAQAHAGMGVSAQAHVVTKGAVSLTLSGRGNGVDLGSRSGASPSGPPVATSSRDERSRRRCHRLRRARSRSETRIYRLPIRCPRTATDFTTPG